MAKNEPYLNINACMWCILDMVKIIESEKSIVGNNNNSSNILYRNGGGDGFML